MVIGTPLAVDGCRPSIRQTPPRAIEADPIHGPAGLGDPPTIGARGRPSGPISRFVDKHPTVKMLALSFLLLIGVTLIGEGFEVHIPKGFIYFAMAFSVLVEILNLRLG